MSFVSKKKWPFFHLLKKVSEGSRRVIFFLLINQNTFCGLDLLCYSLLCVRPENLSNFQLFSQVSLSSQYIYQIELFSPLEGIHFIYVLIHFRNSLDCVSCVNVQSFKFTEINFEKYMHKITQNFGAIFLRSKMVKWQVYQVEVQFTHMIACSLENVFFFAQAIFVLCASVVVVNRGIWWANGSSSWSCRYL